MSEKTRPSYRVPGLAFALSVVVGMALLPGTAAVAEDPIALLPDIRTLRPSDVTMDIHQKPDTRLLRFSNEIMNQGLGPLELGPVAEDCDEDGDPTNDRTAYQHVFQDTETDESPGQFLRMKASGDVGDLFQEVRAGCSFFHPSHNHWHFEDFATYQLSPMTTEGPSETVIGSSDKVSFCLLDSNSVRTDLPGFNPALFYNRCEEDAVSGISVGWADLYTSGLPEQWIDIGPVGSPVVDGTYCLKSTADPSNKLIELKNGNNSRSVRIKIKGASAYTAPRKSCMPRP